MRWSASMRQARGSRLDRQNSPSCWQTVSTPPLGCHSYYLREEKGFGRRRKGMSVAYDIAGALPKTIFFTKSPFFFFVVSYVFASRDAIFSSSFDAHTSQTRGSSSDRASTTYARTETFFAPSSGIMPWVAPRCPLPPRPCHRWTSMDEPGRILHRSVGYRVVVAAVTASTPLDFSFGRIRFSPCLPLLLRS